MTFDIFPPGGLASSVTTVVWVGVFVVVTLNLRFGTTLSGLVIPGYLVPILFINPVIVGVIVFEGLVTYLVALLIAHIVMRRLNYSELFGRDRFFLLIVVSVLVRIFFDNWAFPAIGSWLTDHGIRFDYRNHLHSFGLIIVSLIANQLWNSGAKSGLQILFIYIFITYLIVNFVLSPFTNFNISEIGYMYENLAKSLLASPKAYIILVITAFIASRMNLFYGWDFNGILIPSLLGLQWYQPEKLLFTFVETAIILAGAHIFFRLPGFRNMSFEGSRLLLFFFNISFLYKIVLGFVLVKYFPSVKITDFYGFGYLISTLLAMKMYQKNIAVRMTRATLQTSFVAICIASGIGFLFTLWPDNEAPGEPIMTTVKNDSDAQSLQAYYTITRPTLFQASTVEYDEPVDSELQVFNEALIAVDHYVKDRQDQSLRQAHALLERIDLQLIRVEERYLVITDKQAQRGWGLYVVNLAYKSDLVIQVPDGLSEKYTDIAGLKLFEHLQARAVAISTSKRHRSDRGVSDVSTYPATLFQVFHRHIAANEVLQIRGYNKEFRRRVAQPEGISGDVADAQNILWTKKRLPHDLPLPMLKQWLTQLDIRFSTPPFENIQRDIVASGFAELLLSGQAIRSLVANIVPYNSIEIKQEHETIQGLLQATVLETKSAVARRGSEAYEVPNLGVLLFWDEEVLEPLLALVAAQEKTGWTQDNLDELSRLDSTVSAYNYRLSRFVEAAEGQEYLILREPGGAELKYWGTLVIRLGQSSAYLIEIPHPLFELSTFEFGTSWFMQLNARYLLLAGSHPYANESGLANMSRPGNTQTIFQLSHQALLRASNYQTLLPIQVHGFEAEIDNPNPQEDIQLSFSQALGVPTHLPVAGELYRALIDSGLSVSLFDGRRQAAAYSAGSHQQALYSDLDDRQSLASIWLNPRLQYLYKYKLHGSTTQEQAKGLGVDVINVDVKNWLPEEARSRLPLSERALELIISYSDQQSILQLDQLNQYYPHGRLKLLLDVDSGQEFLLLLDGSGAWQALINPNALTSDVETFNKGGEVPRFIGNRDHILIAGAP